MRRTEKQSFLGNSLVKRLLAIGVMVSILVTLLSQTVFAQNRYLITDGEQVKIHKSFSSDPNVVLDEAGIELSDEDTYTTTYHDGMSCIKIQRQQAISVIYHGEKFECSSYGETVTALLERMELVPDSEDVLSCDGEAITYGGMTIEVVHREVKRETYEEAIPFSISSYEDPELEEGEVLVLIDGVEGTVAYTADVVYENGVEVSRTILSEQVLSAPVTELVVKGPNCPIAAQPHDESFQARDESKPIAPDLPGITPDEPSAPTEVTEPSEEPTVPPTEPFAQDGLLTTTSGTTYRYTQALSVSCTAYSCGDRVGYTYSGTVARVGAVAVDPRYIPLGTKMYIVSDDGCYIYGYCVAEDIGGGIKGLKIDLYFDTFDECWEFGVRNCTAYILE